MRRFRATREARAIGDRLYMFLVQIIFFAYIHITSVPTSVLIVNVPRFYGNFKKKIMSLNRFYRRYKLINYTIIIPCVLVDILYYKLL